MTRLKSRNLRDGSRTLITSAEQMPDFASMTEEQEAEFWETHDFAESVFDEESEVDVEVYEALGIPHPKLK